VAGDYANQKTTRPNSHQQRQGEGQTCRGHVCGLSPSKKAFTAASANRIYLQPAVRQEMPQ